MSGALTIPFIVVNLALVFYTVGVWANFFARKLKWWHLGLFVLGLIFDTWGTLMMYGMAGGKMALDVHYISGLLAFLLMLITVIRAGVILARKDEKALRSYHKFAVLVWLIWLLPFFSPMFFRLVRP